MEFLKDKNLYYVGGVVRDEMLGVKSFDTDYCYEGNAIEFAKKQGLNIIKENPDFGTVRVVFDGKEVDIASTREEFYPKAGHLPKVKNIGCSLSDDLKRRDFTVNAMAKNTVTGEIYDPFGGKSDIEKCVLNVLHEKSFIDDPTRIVRGLKFSVRFGFKLGDEAKKLQDDYLENINYDMSYHRLKKEFKETFELNNGEAYEECISQRIYKLIDKNCCPLKISGRTIEKGVSKIQSELSWVVYLGCITLSETKMPLTRQEKKIIDWAVRLENDPIGNNTPAESIVLSNLIMKGKMNG